MKDKLIKGISLIMVMVLCCSLCIPVYANESINEIEEKIESYIIDFYKSKDIGSESVVSKNNIASKNVDSFLTDKVEVQNYVTSLYETQKENYKIDVKQLGLTETLNNKMFRYQVITTYNYIDADFETTVSEEVLVNYDCNNCEIVNFVTPNNYYDIAVLKEESKSNVVCGKSGFTDEIEKNKKKLVEDINEVFNDEVSKVSDTMLESPRRAAQSYNNSACVTYARNNYNKATPARGKSTVPYYDFSTISGNYDCTNFVSHAILAGGAQIYDTGGTGISSSGWYFRSINNRSSSWSGVTNLYNFLTTNKKANTVAGIGKSYELSGAYWGTGDILQLKNSGASNYGHSTIITVKKRSTDGKRCYAYVTGRTSKTQYNNNQAADDMAPGGSKRTIMIYNN